jgi:hypothetical protein
MTLSRLLKISTLVAMALAVNLTGLAQKRGETVQKWEFMTLSECDGRVDRYEGKVTFQDLLDAAGEQGWELVTVTDKENACARWAFKRLKTERSKPFNFAPPAPQSTAPKCSLTPAQSPAIRGLRLGMSAEELFALFPGGSEDLRKRQQELLVRAMQPPQYGVATLSFSPREFSSGRDRFQGVSGVEVTVFDRRVVRLSVTYSDESWGQDVPVWSNDAWVAKLSAAFGLPGPEQWEWDARFGSTKVLKCHNFEAGVRNYNNSMFFELHDTTYPAQQEQRRKAWREERQKEFKP